MRENEGLVLSILRGFSGSESIKDDLMQEGRIALLKAARTWKPGGEAQFRTYAATAIRNAMLDCVWREGPAWDSLDEESQPDCYRLLNPTPEEVYFAKERAQEVSNAIAALESPWQRGVCERRIEGASFQEIGDAEGFTMKGAFRGLKMALPHLRETLLARLGG